MLKQFSRSAISRLAFVLAAAAALSLGTTLIKDPAQPERRP